ncbi:MAG: glycine zipper 2TM domain-containing protein [Proteobacteria bacterium]|nr:glycine zipper 2TM domain-containing protein [Pseudomonadota bacterium]
MNRVRKTPLWKNIRWFVIAALVAGLCASCASSRSANVYSRDQARQAQNVQMGVVASVKSVLIEGTKTPLGTIAGGALGGVAGSAVGGGKGAQLMTVVGAIAGAAAGTAAEEGITRKQGLEIIVRLDNGTLLSVVQEADVAFQAGDSVKIITGSDGTTRVSH